MLKDKMKIKGGKTKNQEDMYFDCCFWGHHWRYFLSIYIWGSSFQLVIVQDQFLWG